jgi:DNA-directed RNA polymerase subunit RPC12/RpoP
MASYPCPSCGAPIAFRSSFSVYAVCSYCGSTVLRTDRDVSLIGKQADLPDEISPLQIGAKFTYRGEAFELLGRARMAWADGAWTEWFAQGQHRPGWLAEAQGFLALSFEKPLPPALANAPPLGAVISIQDQAFRVSDIKQATCVGSEGELPFAAPRGRSATYYDMTSPGAAFAGLEIAADEQRFYLGEYVDFDAIALHDLREVEGWTVPKSPAQADPRLPAR